MSIEQERSIISSTSVPQPTTVVAAQPVVTGTPVVAATPVVTGPVEHEVHDVRTQRTFDLPAALAGVVAVAMLIIGGVMMARAGLDDSLADPVVTVVGVNGTALGGIGLAAFGLGLLFAALSRERGVIMFFGILTGVAATIIAIEPGVADGDLGIERGFAVVLALAAVVITLAAGLVPTMRSSSRRIDRF